MRETTSIGTIDISTPIGTIKFHVIQARTPLLLCLQDIENIGVHYKNLIDILVKGNKRVAVVQTFGHAWILIVDAEAFAYTYVGST